MGELSLYENPVQEEEKYLQQQLYTSGTVFMYCHFIDHFPFASSICLTNRDPDIVPQVMFVPFTHVFKTHLLNNYFVSSTMWSPAAAFEELTNLEEIQISEKNYFKQMKWYIHTMKYYFAKIKRKNNK